MPKSTASVSLHPYFKVHPGKLETVRGLLPAFVARTQKEAKCLYYDFTIEGDTVFCREAYKDAEGVIEHLDNVGSLLEEMLKHAGLLRLEIHGPSAELDKLRSHCAPLNPSWFVHQCGITR